jgi:hypothetical protein
VAAGGHVELQVCPWLVVAALDRRVLDRAVHSQGRPVGPSSSISRMFRISKMIGSAESGGDGPPWSAGGRCRRTAHIEDVLDFPDVLRHGVNWTPLPVSGSGPLPAMPPADRCAMVWMRPGTARIRSRRN